VERGRRREIHNFSSPLSVCWLIQFENVKKSVQISSEEVTDARRQRGRDYE
jgi:hypothetical protein